MGRHSAEDKQNVDKIDKKRRDALEKFFGLSLKAMKHIEWSLESKVVCSSCAVDANGAHRPGKAKNDKGNCAFCDATGYVPDKEQRNWATGQVADRIAPKPKSVEMAIEQTTTVEELEKDMVSKTDEELQKVIGMDQVLASLKTGAQ